MTDLGNGGPGENGGSAEMENLGKWRRPRENGVPWETEDLYKCRNLATWRTWQNGGPGEMEDLGKWRVCRNGEPGEKKET
jgi:hypothetical protein